MEEPANPADGLRQRMQETRSQLFHDVGSLVHDARSIVDWRPKISATRGLSCALPPGWGSFSLPVQNAPCTWTPRRWQTWHGTTDSLFNCKERQRKPRASSTRFLATVLAAVGREATSWFKKFVADSLHPAPPPERNPTDLRYPVPESDGM